MIDLICQYTSSGESHETTAVQKKTKFTPGIATLRKLSKIWNEWMDFRQVTEVRNELHGRYINSIAYKG